MTRIVGGTLKGHRLATRRGDVSRPTSERVRDALFSAVAAAVGLDGLCWLDLFGGSGAVGLEALSRGASVVTCVENDPRTARLARDNARRLGVTLRVQAAAVQRVLAQPPTVRYDVVYLDPPYRHANAEVERVLRALAGHGWLATEGLVVVERSARDPAPAWPPGLEALRSRRYGETVLWYGHPAPFA